MSKATTLYNRGRQDSHPVATEEVFGKDLRPGDIIVRSYAFTETRRIRMVGDPRSTASRKTSWLVESADDHPLYYDRMEVGRREKILREVAD